MYKDGISPDQLNIDSAEETSTEGEILSANS